MKTVFTKERPIIFSGPMVRAILDGRKTQTRRVVKLPKAKGLEFRWSNAHADPGVGGGAYMHVEFRYVEDLWEGCCHRIYCPYGEIRDRLWVRETWGVYDGREGTNSVEYKADNQPKSVGRWRPSIHMPRWASRITLEITGIRVERLQDISEKDAKAEGVERLSDGFHDYSGELDGQLGQATTSFCTLWQSIHGPYSWNANPWVWVVEFRRVKP